MLKMFLQHPKAIVFSVFLHIVLLGLIIIELSSDTKHITPKPQAEVNTIKAEAIDVKSLEKQKQAKLNEANKKKQLEQKKQQQKAKQAEAKKKAQQQKEAQRKAALAKKKKQEKAKADKKRKDDALKKKQAIAKQKAEKKAEQERLQKAAEKRRKEQEIKKEAAKAAEKKRIEEERLKAERLKKEAELKRIAQEKKRQAEQKLAAEKEQQRKENELQAQIAAEERQNLLTDLKIQYLSAIQQKIQRNWRQPVNAGKMPDCEVNVVQGPGGVILDVTFGQCPGTTNYRLSLENAVYKSEPLPEPKDASLFDRDVKILFKPKN